MPEQRASATLPPADVLFDAAAAGLCLVAPDGAVLRVNPEWLRLTGYRPDEVLGANVLDLFLEGRELASALHARARLGERVRGRGAHARRAARALRPPRGARARRRDRPRPRARAVPDVVICDIGLPESRRLRGARALRADEATRA